MTAWRAFGSMGAILGLSGVALAATGAHLDGGIDNFASYRAWQSASLMQLVHALALIGVAALMRQANSAWLRLAGWLFVAGVVLFCGTVYYGVLNEESAIGGIAPAGGMSLMGGWLALLIHFIRARERV